jgi:2-iminobutanoate/2-iminopropanoate deaminase
MKRKSIYIEGFKHKQPIPNACRVGPLLISGAINGIDPVTGVAPENLAEQCRHMFAHVRSIVEQAGGLLEHIVKINIYLKDRGQREAVNEQWLAMFPDPASRPARHSQDANLQAPILIQCDFTAFIG